MFEIDFPSHAKTVPMKNMKPCDIGIIKDSVGYYDGHVVMRTASTSQFEVMNLTSPGQDKCWTDEPDIAVELLAPGTEIVLRVTE